MDIRQDFIHGKGVLGFVYIVKHIGPDGTVISKDRYENVIPDECVEYLLKAGFTAGSQYPNFYIGLYTENRVPLPSDDMASLLADAVESVSYDGSVRLTMTPDAIENGLYINEASPALFVYTAAAELVRGGFITSSNVRGSTVGLLASALLFPTPKDVEQGGKLEVTAGLQLLNV